jgi:hypothetical protein
MTEPTPVTMNIIERLSESTVSPIGTENAGPRSIHKNDGAIAVFWKKTTHAQKKLPSTAPTEINPLKVRIGRVAIMMRKAEARGRRSAIQGSTDEKRPIRSPPPVSEAQ